MRHVRVLALLTAAGCASARGPGPRSSETLRAAELSRMRCLLVAPLQNASDVSGAAEAATQAVLSGISATGAGAFPVEQLRDTFKDTPLELPAGLPPDLALELAEILGADGALYGTVEGRAGSSTPSLMFTIRLVLSGERDVLFATSAPVQPRPGEAPAAAVRRTVEASLRPLFMRLGTAPSAGCFDAARTEKLRALALAAAGPAPAPEVPLTLPPPATAHEGAKLDAPETAAAAPDQPTYAIALAGAGVRAKAAAVFHPAPGLAMAGADRKVVAPGEKTARPAPAPAVPAAKKPRNARQAAWAKKLSETGRFVLDGLAFKGRTAQLGRDTATADLVGALAALPGQRVRLEGFVDATSDPESDARLSMAMAQAVYKKLVDLGVSKDRLTFAGRGHDHPLLPNFTPRGRMVNRRVEVVGILH